MTRSGKQQKALDTKNEKPSEAARDLDVSTDGVRGGTEPATCSDTTSYDKRTTVKDSWDRYGES